MTATFTDDRTELLARLDLAALAHRPSIASRPRDLVGSRRQRTLPKNPERVCAKCRIDQNAARPGPMTSADVT